MKKILVAMAAFAALIGTPALAADMPVKAAPLPAPLCVWCGWYIGVNAGWVGPSDASFRNTGSDTDGGGLGNALATAAIPGTVTNNNMNGFIGGGQIGYNWQTGIMVVGLEADFDGVSDKNTINLVFPGSGASAPFTTTYTHQLDWLSTFRGRLGVTVSPDFLIYFTGGVAVGEVKTGNSFICPTCGPSTSTEPSTTSANTATRAGIVIGLGAEWMVAPHWSIKAEYLYADLGSTNSTIVYTYGPNTSSLTSTVHNNYNIARGGVDWHF
ncbi:MAG: outer membrane beta-barrel protein [Xanthobacteraceae bacterium]|jgi:outer membrane immunogenic protein